MKRKLSERHMSEMKEKILLNLVDMLRLENWDVYLRRIKQG
jgi:hypothetical protein